MSIHPSYGLVLTCGFRQLLLIITLRIVIIDFHYDFSHILFSHVIFIAYKCNNTLPLVYLNIVCLHGQKLYHWKEHFRRITVIYYYCVESTKLLKILHNLVLKFWKISKTAIFFLYYTVHIYWLWDLIIIGNYDASNNILLDHTITHGDLNISISRKSLETLMNTNDLSSLTAKTKKKTSINSIENYINNKYDEIALSHLKQSILPEVHATINQKIISIPKTDEVTYLKNHIDNLISELYFLREELQKKYSLIKILLNKTEVIKHVTIRNNKTLKDG